MRQGATPMKFTISAAARMYGKHRATLHRHIKQGLLSCESQRNGAPVLDLSELIRCYGEPKSPPEDLRQDATGDVASSITSDATGSDTALIDEIRRQTAVIERMADRIERLEQALLQLPAPSPKEEAQPSPQQSGAKRRHQFSDLVDNLRNSSESD